MSEEKLLSYRWFQPMGDQVLVRIDPSNWAVKGELDLTALRARDAHLKGWVLEKGPNAPKQLSRGVCVVFSKFDYCTTPEILQGDQPVLVPASRVLAVIDVPKLVEEVKEEERRRRQRAEDAAKALAEARAEVVAAQNGVEVTTEAAPEGAVLGQG